MKETDFALHINGFFSRYLPGQRNLSMNTITSYRDAFKLFLLFCETEKTMKADKISISDLTPGLLTEYLAWLERIRHCGVRTRNQRLAAFKSFFHYVASMQPEHILNCQRILDLPMKKVASRAMTYFSPEGLHLLLSQPDTSNPKGRRDHALLVLLYDTAARVQEIIDLRIRDVRLEQPATVTLHGKGRKTRVVPVTAKTASIMEGYFQEKGWIEKSGILDFSVFMNNRECKLSRAGVAYILSKYVKSMSIESSHHIPESVSPHCLRHTKAVHLLRSGVPLIYIRDILGHASVITTEIYAKVDAEEKRKALEDAYEVPSQDIIPNWEKDKGLMSWLSELCG
ncbi:tyrosine-type recombinase/integrase [Desulfobulbus rhabdoformis]|uniref:tyrosine-type recombinase/integrase n=1 Tax=Desulfobulbus rhabdoformis TaxID=34032 RepID=UPI0019640399|nr:tyrosine-type recombinase/integrase [Desulfobulbus rhabdoformis]MBM9617015.1 tyrosine-type recombinase/integrase [Desulfobulbus rhabdoformis]